MSDYIKREDAIKAYAKAFNLADDCIEYASVILKDIPPADVVEVVRCKDCEHFEAINNDDHGWCKLISDLPCEMSVRYDDDYCSYGERADT